MNRLAIFDCDGTPVDSGAIIVATVAEAFALHGLQAPPPEQCRRVIGLSLFEAMAALAPDADPADQDKLLADVLESALDAGKEAVERGPEQLAVLRESGVVDAGAYGLTVIVAGLIAALRGEDRRAAWLHRDADLLPGFPRKLMGSSQTGDGASSPALADLDGDNRN